MRRTAWTATALVMVGLVVMTSARFVRTDLRWPILVASFSAYAALGFVMALLGCAIAVGRSHHRRWVGVVALVAVAGLAVQGWALAPFFVGGANGKPDLTVMTSNLEFGRGDTATVVRIVAAQHVDVLVLEEVTPTALSGLLADGLGDLLPHRQGTPVVMAAGTMVFSRWALDDARPFEVRNTGLDLRVGAPEPFRLLAVHTAQPIIAPKEWLTDLRSVRERSSTLVEEGPTLVVGDFNATRDHEPWRAILGAGLRDAAEEAGSGWQPTWPNDCRGWVLPLIMIDHVLTTHQYVTTRTRTVVVPGTDHRALVAELGLRHSHGGNPRTSPAAAPGQ
ncbi:MAG: endonuclease/exonuclease/phosphatase family protein [Marmoricola sp.]